MPIRMRCPHCPAVFNLSEALLGKQARCSACGKVFLVPGGAPKPAPADDRVTRQPVPAAKPPAVPPPAAAAKPPAVPPPVPVAKSPPPPPAPPAAVRTGPPPANAVAPASRPNKDLPSVRRAFPRYAAIAGGVLLLAGGTLVAVLLLNRGPAPAAKLAEDKPPADKPPADAPPDDPQPVKPPAKPANFNIAEVRKSVVYIKRSAPGRPLSTGTGFLVSADGLVYTNRHVAQNDPPLPGTQLLVGVPSPKNSEEMDYFKAALVSVPEPNDPLDFAVLKIAARADYGAFPALPAAAEKPDLGAPVAVVGFPAIVDHAAPTLSFNKGSISATRVAIETKNYYQTDAAINPGNSGGPLVNERGEFVGVVTLRKPGASNMGYALQLGEIRPLAAPRPEQLARAGVEAGPLDPKALQQTSAARTEAVTWQVNRGKTESHRAFMTIDNNGGVYWMTTRETLPENFLITMEIGVEFLQGGQRLQATQRSILRTLIVRFSSDETDKDILMQEGGYRLQYSHQYLRLYREGEVLRNEPVGNSGEPFLLTIARVKGDVLVLVNDRLALRQRDPKPLPGVRSKLSVGGYLSRLYVGKAVFTALEGDVPDSLLALRDPKREPLDLPKAKDPVIDDKPPVDPVKKPDPAALEVKTPAPIGEVVVAAGGRLLVASLPSQKKLLVLDVARGKVVKELTTSSDAVKIAAGQDKLLVLTDGRQLERWDLQTFEREATGLSPFEDKIQQLCMGSASKGPLVVAGGRYAQGALGFLDPETLQPLPLQGKVDFPLTDMRASADGKLFTVWARQGGDGRGIVKVAGDQVTFQVQTRGAPSHLLPGAEGQALFAQHHLNERGFNSYTGAIYDADGKLVRGGREGGDEHSYFPFQQGRGYFDFVPRPGPMVLECFDEKHLPLGKLEGFAWGRSDWGDNSIYFDRRLMVFPQSKRVVLIPGGNNRVLFYNIELK